MTSPKEDLPIGSTAHDELDLEPPADYGVPDGPTQGHIESAAQEQEEALGRETIELKTHMLGLHPYVLIQAIVNEPVDGDDDGIRLRMEQGGGILGAELATLFVISLPAEDNPFTAAIKAVIDANPERPEVVEVLSLFAEFCDLPMPELEQ
jgi:hypothetical protein